jgi:hypothetical protein
MWMQTPPVCLDMDTCVERTTDQWTLTFDSIVNVGSESIEESVQMIIIKQWPYPTDQQMWEMIIS